MFFTVYHEVFCSCYPEDDSEKQELSQHYSGHQRRPYVWPNIQEISDRGVSYWQ